MPKRTPKLLVFKWVGAPQAKIEAAAWQRMEAALGTKIDQSAIDDIRDVTQTYLSEAYDEMEASYVADAEAYLAEIRKKIGELLKLCSKFSRAPRDPSSCALYEINRSFKDDKFTDWSMDHSNDHYPVEHFTKLLAALDTACQNGIVDLNNPNMQRLDGDAWRYWIIELTAACKRNILPTTARKDVEESSAFVAFVRELQLELPVQYRRHMHSDSALAAAISKARRQERDE